MSTSRFPSPWHLIALAIIGLLLPVASQAKEHLLILGDSLGAGYGVSLEQRWSTLLQARLDRQYPGTWTVINASISGETTDGGLRRLPALLDKYQPALVLVELGGNDGLRGFPLDVTQQNLEAMVAKVQKTGAHTLLIGIRLPPNYGPRYTEAFAKIYSTVAERYKVPLVPFLLAGIYDQPGMMQGDGLHPTAKAQPQVLDVVWPKLAPLVAPSQRGASVSKNSTARRSDQ